LDREVERGFPRCELQPLRSLTWHGYPPTRTTGPARIHQSRCCRNHVADVVSASLTRATRAQTTQPHSPSRPRAPACPRGGNDVPVVILLRSRIDSEMCRQRAPRKAHGPLPTRARKALCFGHLKRKDRFPSGLESYLLACAHFAPLRRAINHGGQSDDTQPSRYAQAFG